MAIKQYLGPSPSPGGKRLYVGLFALGLAAVLYGYLSRPKSSRRVAEYRYESLPAACGCDSCGYVIENPGCHCTELTCPVCGARMWRLR